jgi:hypothetical protein
MATVTAGQVVSVVQETQAVADTILATIQGVDPGAALESGTLEVVIDATATMAAKAIQAWSQASGEPITAASVMELLPDAAPLDQPDAPAAVITVTSTVQATAK